jgi:hypothetical protein
VIGVSLVDDVSTFAEIVITVAVLAFVVVGAWRGIKIIVIRRDDDQ